MPIRTLTHWLRKPGQMNRTSKLNLLAFEDRITPTVVTFQEGFPLTIDTVAQTGTYVGTADTEINSEAVSANSNFGDVVSVSIDQQGGVGTQQTLLRFDNIFGDELGQIPAGAQINSAKVTLRVASSTNNESFVSFNRMLVPWDENGVTWNSFPSVAGGVQFDGIEAAEAPDADLLSVTTDPANQPIQNSNIFATFDLTPSVRAWAAGEPNYGWLNHQFGENGWDWRTSEFTTNTTHRPKLTVDYTAPTGAGVFSFLDTTAKVAETNSGSKTYTYTVVREAGSTGPATVDVVINAPAGTATSGSDYTFVTQPVSFANGVRSKTFTVTVQGDTIIEGPETIRLKLDNATGATISGTRGTATVNIVDNELLINEVVNVNSSGGDLGYEFLEIFSSTGNVGLGNITGINGTADHYNVYVLAINGDTAEVVENPVGPTAAIGIIDTVTNLSTASTGSAGLLVVRPTAFQYYASPPAGANDFIETLLDTEPAGGTVGEGRWDNSSITFALVLSKSAITAGTDIDNGSNGGIADDGIIDNLPAGAILLDSIATNDNLRPSSDRALGEFWAGIRQVQSSGYIDAFTRFNSLTDNDLQANRIPSWYAGDLKADRTVYEDPQATLTLGKATPNTPVGARITPGGLNIPRALSFTSSLVSVNETDLTATILLNRTGDDTVAVDVSYTTVDGTATAGSDYTTTAGVLSFGVGINQLPIVVNLLNDSDPEGFHDFFVNVSNATPAQFVIATSQARITISDDDSLIKHFQQEVDGYLGTRDTTLDANAALVNDNLSSNSTIELDQQAGTPDAPVQGLIRFNDLFGSNANQVPAGSRIYGGQLTLNVVDAADASTRIRFFRMLQDWDPLVASWSNPLGVAGTPVVANGITPDGIEASAVADFEVNPASRFGQVTVDVPANVLQAWANGGANYGWSIVSQSGNGWDFDSSEAFLASARPKLSVIYTEPAGKAGGFQFEQPSYTVNEGGTAGTATFKIIRVGGNTGTATVTYTLQNGTGTVVDDFGAGSGMFSFPDGGITEQTITVTLSEDNASERNETFLLALTASTGAPVIVPSSTVTIRDNDLSASLLLNEVSINPPATDAPFEYLELIGTAGVGLGNVYLVGMEGDNNVFAGNADIVADLSSLNNGTTGFTVVTTDVGGHAIPAGTTQFKTVLLSSGNNNPFRVLQNETNSYLLVHSPLATLSSDVFDYDWNNDGTLELPAGAVIIDAFGINDGTVGDLNYTAATLTLATATPDAATRIAGNTAKNDAAAWYYGDYVNNLGNASRYYIQQPSTGSSANVPAGAVITPGAANFAVNTAPAITSNGGVASSTVAILTGTTAVTTVTFTDPDIGQPFAFALSGPDAAKFTINNATGALAFAAAPNAATPTDAGADNVYNVTVTLTDGTASDAQDLAVRVVPTVTGFTVNGGDAQRSRLTTVTVNFSGAIDPNFLSTLGAVSFTRTAGGPLGTVVQTGASGANGLISVAQPGPANSVVLTFSNANAASTTDGVEYGSLSDGRWQLAIPAAGFASTVGDPLLVRIFGDINGDLTVDGTNDFAAFGNLFGTTLTGSPFDFNIDGTIDGTTDFAEFGGRFGITV